MFKQKFYPVSNKYALVIGGDSQYKHYDVLFGLLDYPNDIVCLGDRFAKATRVIDISSIRYNHLFFIIRNAEIVIGDVKKFIDIIKEFNIPFIEVNDELPNKIADKVRKSKNKKIFKNILDLDIKFIGSDYNIDAYEYVPNHLIHPNSLSGKIIAARMDLEFDENYLVGNLSNYKHVIYTSKPIDFSILKKFYKNISELVCLVKDDTMVDFANSLLGTGLKFYLVSDNPTDYLRYIYYDIGNIHTLKSVDMQNENNLKCLSRKLLLSNGKVYASAYHWKENVEYDLKFGSPIDDVKNIKNDMHSMLIYR